MTKSKITCATLLLIMLFSVLTPCMATKPVITQYQSPYDNVHTVPEEFKNGPFTMIYDSPEGIHVYLYDKPPKKVPDYTPDGDPVIGYICTKPHDPHIMHVGFVEGYDEHDLYIMPGSRPIGIFKGGVEYERGPNGHIREKRVKTVG